MNFKKIDGIKEEGFCLVKSAATKKNVKGALYLDLVLVDSDGEIPAKLWDYDQGLHGKYTGGETVKVRGTTESYNGQPQFRIDRIRPATDGDAVDYASIVPCAPYDSAWMYEQLLSIAQGFGNGELNRLVTTLLEQGKEQLLYFPAALKLHHAVRGGLLYHLLTVVRLAEKICEIYPFADRELLLAGVILHDIAKLGELTVGESGLASDYTEQGNLLGHLVMGAMRIHALCRELDVSDHTAMLLEHMLISHHTQPEYGSPVRPMFLEAMLLAMLDDLDAKVYIMTKTAEKMAPGSFSERLWSMDNRRVYKAADGQGYQAKL